MVIFSGIQPTGRKHLGNYIGAIINYVEGQDRGDPAIYCIVDLHATTVNYEPSELRKRSQETAALLSKTVLTISHRAGEDGRLFGSVTAKEISEALRQARGLHIDRRKVRLAEPIREVGTHMVEIEVTDDVTASVKTIVVEEK